MIPLITAALSVIMSETSIEVFPIHFVIRKNCYKQYLYDIDGCLIRGGDGKPLNVFQHEMMERFDNGSLRIVRVLEPGYRYFVQRQSQQDRFIREREQGGSECRFRSYHIYVDEDTHFEWFTDRNHKLHHSWDS